MIKSKDGNDHPALPLKTNLKKIVCLSLSLLNQIEENISHIPASWQYESVSFPFLQSLGLPLGSDLPSFEVVISPETELVHTLVQLSKIISHFSLAIPKTFFFFFDMYNKIMSRVQPKKKKMLAINQLYVWNYFFRCMGFSKGICIERLDLAIKNELRILH